MAEHLLPTSWRLASRSSYLPLVLVAVIVVASGCSSMKVTVYPSADPAGAVAPSDPAAIVFLDPWATDADDYEVLGHLWAKGKQDFSRSGPGLVALETAMRTPAAELGADAVLGLTNGNSTIWMGSLWYPKPGIGIDTHWASGIAVKKRAPGSPEAVNGRPLWVTILPILATSEIGSTAKPGSLEAIKALLETAGQYVLGEKGYHADVMPITALAGDTRFSPESAAVQSLADRACPWADYLLLLGLCEPGDLNSEGLWSSAKLVSAVYSVRDGQWIAMRQDVGSRGELDIEDALRALGDDLEFLPIVPDFGSADGWNRSVVSGASRAADLLPSLKLPGAARKSSSRPHEG